MKRIRLPDCLDFVLGEQGITYPYEGDITKAVEDIFTPVRKEQASVVIARIAGGIVGHIAPYDPLHPDDITHRPGPGREVRQHQTFDEAIGHYLRRFSNSSIEFGRRR